MISNINGLAVWEIPDGDFLQGLLMSLFCIAVVFIILTIITLILAGVNKIKALDVKEKVKMKDGTELDEDAMAAVLVATLDYRKEKKEDVKVISCKLIDDEKANRKKKKN
jgi:Na+-transporting methylmalonyl-CoA/oxaloacetate decarboxylase gamma subunit